jgi:hypothetical protein
MGPFVTRRLGLAALIALAGLPRPAAAQAIQVSA